MTGVVSPRRLQDGTFVRGLQVTLTRLGHPCHPDGVFGSATQQQVRAYQEACKLPVTGFPNRDTLCMAALETFILSQGEKS